MDFDVVSFLQDSRSAVLRLIMAAVAFVVAADFTFAQSLTNETVLYSFTGGSDGYNPLGRLIFDSKGALYGTTVSSGTYSLNEGTVFKLTPPVAGQTQWAKTVLHTFTCSLGSYPEAGVIFDSKGALYGTTHAGGPGAGTGCPQGAGPGKGAVFKLTPPAAGQTQWTETVLYSFTGGSDGGHPGAVIFDSKGALYGTADSGGGGSGAVFKLRPPAAGQTQWTETVLYSFTGGSDGSNPRAVIFDSKGALYGTTFNGGGTGSCSGPNGMVQPGCGTVFKLTPPATGHTQWTEIVLYSFTGGSDGGNPSGVILDSKGALYGTTLNSGGGTGCSVAFGQGCGTVFKLTPPAAGQTQWTLTVLHTFTGGSDGGNPFAGLIFDSKGALYGTTANNGASDGSGCNNVPYGCGTVFKLTPPAAGHTQWTKTVLHSFTGGSDGSFPSAGLIFDSKGGLYGTTRNGGPSGDGTVFKLQ
jgi:uncharacterized protein YceK